MELKGRRVIILVEEMYNEYEYWYPYYRLKEAGADVTVVGSGSSETYKSKSGLQVSVNTSADHVSAADYDGIVIPGGYAPDLMRRYPSMVKLVKDLFEAGKVVAAICHAGWMLASAGIVQGKTVTCFFSIKDDLIHAGANYVDQEVVVDGNLITSRKPDDLPAFMKAVIAGLQGSSG
ncbi:MAG: DJ-1/PfpI/YhbO family deglycase/protease [Proteobacteria bacterium]|nr:DJ-1/PfpI/YhbO family deglycase/protease [Pseudomonadota bacterium]